MVSGDQRGRKLGLPTANLLLSPLDRSPRDGVYAGFCAARIASDLLASLDSEAVDEDTVDELWSVETQRRAAMLDAGEAGTLSWGEIEQRFVAMAERRLSGSSRRR